MGSQRHPWHQRDGWRRAGPFTAVHAWVESKRQWHKLEHKRLRLEARRNLFPMRMVQQWDWGAGSLCCLQPGRFEAQTGWNPEQPGLIHYLNVLWVGISSSLQTNFSSVGCVLTWCFIFFGMFYVFFIIGGDSFWLALYSPTRTASFSMTCMLTFDILHFFPVSCSLLRSSDENVSSTVKKGLKKLVPKLKQNKNVKGIEALLEKLTS